MANSNLLDASPNPFNDLSNKMIVQLACHAGADLTGAYTWTDAYFEKNLAVLVASTAYTYYSCQNVAYAERFLHDMADRMGYGIGTLGHQFWRSKQLYLNYHPGYYTDYDLKTVQTYVFYGLPMYTLYNPTMRVDDLTDSDTPRNSALRTFSSQTYQIDLTTFGNDSGATGDGVLLLLRIRTLSNATTELFISHLQLTDIHGNALSASTGTGKINRIPHIFSVEQNYPNPFNPSTTIAFALPKPVDVAIHIYNLTGRLVKTLLNESKQAGRYEVVWDGRNNNAEAVGSGTYFYVVLAGERQVMKKMVLLK